ncbi:hypothetical protein AABB24_030071, partial [Solanum stoloniferum]
PNFQFLIVNGMAERECSVLLVKPLLSLKKTFFYNFFPSKEEEEACKLKNTPYVVTQELIEIRDIYPPPKIDLENPWQIKIKITSYEVEAGALLIPYIETFEYILRYWTLDMAKILVNGCRVCVQVWDVTTDNAPKKYEAFVIVDRTGQIFIRMEMLIVMNGHCWWLVAMDENAKAELIHHSWSKQALSYASYWKNEEKD